MNHASIVAAESERLYSHRNYVLGRLDQRHFDALNPGAHVLGLNGYCLDALDDTPMGCMVGCARYPAQAFTARGLSWADMEQRRALAERLVAEILLEESPAACTA